MGEDVQPQRWAPRMVQRHQSSEETMRGGGEVGDCAFLPLLSTPGSSPPPASLSYLVLI